MEQLKPPGMLSMEGNISENWRRWRQRFELFLVASGAAEKQGGTKVAILLHTVGEEDLEAYNTFKWETGEEKKVDTVLSKFQKYFEPQKNPVFERYLFGQRKQLEGESIDHYITDLKVKIKDCEYGELTESILRDRVNFEVRCQKLKERLLREQGSK